MRTRTAKEEETTETEETTGIENIESSIRVTPRRNRLLLFPHGCPHKGSKTVTVPKLLLRFKAMLVAVMTVPVPVPVVPSTLPPIGSPLKKRVCRPPSGQGVYIYSPGQKYIYIMYIVYMYSLFYMSNPLHPQFKHMYSRCIILCEYHLDFSWLVFLKYAHVNIISKVIN